MKMLRLWIGLIGAPLAWLAQVMLSQSVSSYACHPHYAALSQPLWQRLPLGIIALDIVCLGFSLIACGVNWKAWQHARHEIKGRVEHAIESGETRESFLAMLGVLSSTIFVTAIIFTACAIFIVSPCGPSP